MGLFQSQQLFVYMCNTFRLHHAYYVQLQTIVPHKCTTVATHGHICVDHLFRAGGPHQCSADTYQTSQTRLGVIRRLPVNIHSFIYAIQTQLLYYASCIQIK